jgi:5-methylcytosine-specific restriction endonuclease McrA
MSTGDILKKQKIDRFIAVAKSSDTFHQIHIDIKDEYKRQLLQRDGCVCCTRYGFGCGKELLEGELGIDHIIEIAMGGPVCEIGNMQLLCQDCHRNKTNYYDKKLIQIN